MPSWLYDLPITVFVFAVIFRRTLGLFLAENVTQLRADGGEEAMQLARFFRLTAVWAILTIGSALALAAGIIGLILAYQ